MNEIDVEPVLPTYAKTKLRLFTSIATVYVSIMTAVVITAKRKSLMSSGFGRTTIFLFGSKELRLGLPEAGVSSSPGASRLEFVLTGRHLLIACRLARHG